MRTRSFIFVFLGLLVPLTTVFAQEINLNGPWQSGLNKVYDKTVTIPSISEDPTIKTPGTLWFKKEITLPKGDWQQATLILKGARFSPKVYINNDLVSEQEGGMAPTFHFLKHDAIHPGNKIILEIALKSLKDLPQSDASYIPTADHWRSNISSCLWDDVILHLHGHNSIQSMIPYIDLADNKCKLKIKLNHPIEGESPLQGKLTISDANGEAVLSNNVTLTKQEQYVDFSIAALKKWSPETPNLYKLKLSLKQGKQPVDTQYMNFAKRSFHHQDKQFFLNNEPCKLRAGTVVWHRWMRDEEGRALGFNEDWFLKNVVNRMKEYGANTMRYHLGNPPERFLDMCDKHGLLVQYEWSFFHGMPASKESLVKQWKHWLDLAMKHPSVVLIHPYNETQGKELETAWNALEELIPHYPELVMAERDVIHIHKYWWSLFENLALYYDSYDQFPKAIMVDEFGGNYLDGNGDVGGYKTTKSAYMRFLGKNHTKEMRLAHHAQSNAKVAEYWRRIDAAGFSPFCILGSHQDGDHWYMGQLKDGKLKPVWDALSAAWAPISVSMDTWDRHYTSGQHVTIPLHLFNDLKADASSVITVGVKNNDKVIQQQTFSSQLKGYSHIVKPVQVTVPEQSGAYTFFAQLESKQNTAKRRVVSTWDFRVLETTLPEPVKSSTVATFSDERELTALLEKEGCKLNSKKAGVILGSRASWEKISNHDESFINAIEEKINKGTSVILLDIGPRFYGQANIEKDLGPLQGKYRVQKAREEHVKLPYGVEIAFSEVSESESHIHPAKDTTLWEHLPDDAHWLWNGKRAGIIVPATTMKISGLSKDALMNLWKARGADIDVMQQGNYYAFNLQGFYAFSTDKDDKKVTDQLRKKVKFLVEDAPSLQNSIDPNAKIEVIDLKQRLESASLGKAQQLTPLVVCGGSHEKTPVILIDFGKGKGKLILSQLLTNGRLNNPSPEPGTYATREDVATKQLILNMIKRVL
ncbi:glycoside hydrolase [Puteibacter caeruleilacunae]|nr:glycoside hydrolase [Puteibacter caeruleilacunae]